ncbi:hypothetical protein [Salinimicrobium xinjiangense]|uniref:hypothetical protein n=1 Tax=Salinimicrobium xinjiangense TaxID=438596 RepID=UPI0012EB7931|nr:hypothetical protein [Salinimicrobium xinjiangense]
MKSQLKLQGKVDLHPQPEIEESIRGVEYDFFYTGKRQALRSPVIELHITSTVCDWAENVYIRKAWYMGHKDQWKQCIEDHVRQHLLDLSAGHMLVMRLMQDFEIGEKHFKEWDKYNPNHFRTA